MTGRVPFDDFRDLLEGRLDAESAARLRAELASDPAIAAEFAAFGEVHAFTAAAACAAPASTVTFERIDAARRPVPVRRLRPWMAAAALLVAATAGAAIWHANAPHTVTLRSISLTLPVVARADAPGDVPAVLAGYRPVADRRVHWLDSLDAGRRVALATNRPILLWIYHPQCPVCTDWDQGAFRSDAIDSQVARFVPVRLNVMEAPPDVQRLCEKGWPYLGVLAADGRPIVEFAGLANADEIAAELAKAASVQTQLGAPVGWDAAADAAAAIGRGSAARDAKRYADAYREFADAAAKARSGPMKSAASAGLYDIAVAASAALTEAKQLAETDEAAGARRLSEAVERFHGTPYGLDLAEVEQELRATGRFPVLVETHHE